MKELLSIKSNASEYKVDSYKNLLITNSNAVNSQDDDYESDDFSEKHGLRRGLKLRHVQLIALGGCIGTGLFVGTGSSLLQCGAASLLISYAIMSLVLYLVMNMLGEMTTFLPLPGNGPQSFVNNYVDSSLGFAIGYNYWYSFAMLVATEVTAAAIVIQYWNDTINIAAWISILLVVVLVLNMSSVKYFGEFEFYFASLKLFAITGLIILGIVLFFGGGPNHDRLGFRYWKNGGAFKQHLVSGGTGRFLGVWTAIIKSGFAFICAPELVSLTGGECEKPRRNLPKACDRFVYRLIFFYIFGTLVIGVICNSNSPRLMSASSDASASPFVIGIQNAGIPALNHIINAAILTSAASSGNSFLYSASRCLYALALNDSAPRIFKRVNRAGVPYYCVLISWAIACLSYLNCSSSSSDVFTWFSNICTISGFISWIAVSIAYLRWRKAIKYNNLEDRVTYRTPFQPYGTYFVIGFIGLLTLTNGYAVFFSFTAGDFLGAYITFPIVFFLYCGHKIFIYLRTKKLKWVNPIEEIDLITGLDLIEEEDRLTPERVPKNLAEKIWFWIA
ncbi:uncharacterized protein PRCAT00004252001 [Priceomyces carsonii]|uniref:uncharacterized protein n=1 Tax=Priceomyces carsonii TaxID=28549 RepID=UPI002EDB9C89|nr:unnamed protein product [Priceomyces carsonii]